MLSDHYKERSAGTECKTCSWYARLDDDDKAFFDEKAATGNATTLWRACKEMGLVVDVGRFRHHIAEHHGAR